MWHKGAELHGNNNEWDKILGFSGGARTSVWAGTVQNAVQGPLKFRRSGCNFDGIYTDGTLMEPTWFHQCGSTNLIPRQGALIKQRHRSYRINNG
jgi:hypothetical protein